MTVIQSAAHIFDARAVAHPKFVPQDESVDLNFETSIAGAPPPDIAALMSGHPCGNYFA